MRRRLLPAVVLLAFTGALVGASSAAAPAHLPAVALGAVLVWRAEVAASLFVAAYVAVVAVHPSLHGRTFTRVGSAGVEIPDVTERRVAEQEARVKTDELDVSLTTLAASVSAIAVRIRALERARDVEDARDLLLPSDEGDLR